MNHVESPPGFASTAFGDVLPGWELLWAMAVGGVWVQATVRPNVVYRSEVRCVA